MQINLQEQGNSIKAFLNVAGVSRDTDTATANKLIEAFVAELNSGKLTLTSFKDTSGKWVIGWKQPIPIQGMWRERRGKPQQQQQLNKKG